ncbi:MAG: hypothetical protein M0023_09215 [Desulfobacteraceae bacterium]|nr:hypothetical protein [Desulfobacteraceae bacterium]
MAPKKMHVIIWLVKAAELDVIRKCCMKLLAGLHFDFIYTLPYAMCLNTVSEILSTLEIEEDQNIISTTRFSSIGLIPPEEMALMQKRLADFVKKSPVTIDVWRNVAANYVDMAVAKAQRGVVKTLAELAKEPGNAFTLLSINNDKIPLLELLGEPLDSALRIPAEGEIVELRFEGVVEGEDVQVKLVYAAHGTLA